MNLITIWLITCVVGKRMSKFLPKKFKVIGALKTGVIGGAM
jgi:hypothetical protein